MQRILRKVAPWISILGLVVIIGYSILVFRGTQSKETYIMWTNIATCVWFLFSPFWLIKAKKQDQA